MKLKIGIIKPVKNKFGANDFVISQIQAYEVVNGERKYIKAIKLTDELCDMINKQFIEGDFENLFSNNPNDNPTS